MTGVVVVEELSITSKSQQSPPGTSTLVASGLLPVMPSVLPTVAFVVQSTHRRSRFAVDGDQLNLALTCIVDEGGSSLTMSTESSPTPVRQSVRNALTAAGSAT